MAAAKRTPSRPGPTLVIASVGVLLVLVAFTIPLATMPATAAALGAGGAAQAWIMSGMSVGAAAALLSSGAIGDDYGRKRVFVIGAIILGISSIIGAMAPTAGVLVAARIVQGIGGAAMVACSLGLIAHTFPVGPARTRATGIWGAALGGGVALGPLLAVGLNGVGGWRMSYLATGVFAALITVCGALMLAESRSEGRRKIDVGGTLLLGVGLACVLAGLIELREGDANSGLRSAALLASGTACLAGFVTLERRIRYPMLDLGLFRRRDFVAATIAALAAGAGALSLMSFVPTVMERALGNSEIEAATTLLAWSAVSAVTAVGVRWLPEQFSPRAQMAIGLVGVAAGQLALVGIAPGTSIARLVPGLLVVGAANGLLNAALGRQAVATVPQDRAAMGSGANNTARYLGSAIGITVVAVALTGTGGPAQIVSGWNLAVLVTAAFSIVGALVVLGSRPSRSAQT